VVDDNPRLVSVELDIWRREHVLAQVTTLNKAYDRVLARVVLPEDVQYGVVGEELTQLSPLGKVAELTELRL
jgi:hypothetical protein